MTQSVLLLLINVVFQVRGNIIKGLNLEWGVNLRCTKINLFPDITVTDCYEECLKREKCQSLTYVVHYKRCVLCANEGSVENGSRYAGHVHSRKRKWNKELKTSARQCSATQTCDTDEASLPCRVKECPELPVGQRAIVIGNVLGVGSHVIYTCPASDVQEGGGRLTCRDAGSWTTAPSLACSAYLGCYADRWTRSLPYGPHIHHSMTTERCRDICRNIFPTSETFYFGTQHFKECYCSINAPRYPQTPEGNCFKRCAGNQAQICGGGWRLSVYQTFQAGTQPKH